MSAFDIQRLVAQKQRTERDDPAAVGYIQELTERIAAARRRKNASDKVRLRELSRARQALLLHERFADDYINDRLPPWFSFVLMFEKLRCLDL